jgi:hypothetical protein
LLDEYLTRAQATRRLSSVDGNHADISIENGPGSLTAGEGTLIELTDNPTSMETSTSQSDLAVRESRDPVGDSFEQARLVQEPGRLRQVRVAWWMKG